MMNSRCLRLIAITILINCIYSGRLSIEENEKRIANCGKSVLSTPEKGKTQEGSPVTFGDNSYVVRVQTLHHSINTASGFFISPRHILTSSQSVFNEQRQWLFDKTDFITKDACKTPIEVPSNYINEIRVLLYNFGELDGLTDDVSNITNAYLLSHCREEGKFDVFFSPMLIELEKDRKDVKFPCIADSTTEVNVGDEVHAYRWQSQSPVYSKPYYFKRKINSINSELITTPEKQYKDEVRGGPLVKHGTPKGTLVVAIDATTGYNDQAQNTYYHNIKAFEMDLCKHAGVCALAPPPSTTETVTTPEGESTTLNPNAQLSTDPSSSDSSGPSTSKPTKRPSGTSMKSTTPPQRTIDEYEVHPADILYDKEKRREKEEDVDNDFFVSADFRTNSNGEIGFSWIMGTFVMVLLV